MRMSTTAVVRGVLWLSGVASVVHAVGCSDDRKLSFSASVFNSDIKSIVVEVDYQAGADPATMFAGGNPWELLANNVASLFGNSKEEVRVPVDLSTMQRLDGLKGGRGYTTQDIVDLADKHRDEKSTESQRSYYILFLDGYFFDDDRVKKSVLGVSVTETGIIAIFKPTIRSSRDPRVRVFVEQSTLIHEFGHSVGLVNNGLPMVRPHHDKAHGAHCTNPDCVMYYLNEGGSDLETYVDRFGMTMDSTLYGPECLEDAAAMLPKTAVKSTP